MKPFKNKSQMQPAHDPAPLEAYWALTAEQLVTALRTSSTGLQQTDADGRLKQYGLNALRPRDIPRSLGCYFASLKARSS